VVNKPEKLICPHISTTILAPVKGILETQPHIDVVALKIQCQGEECQCWSKERNDCGLKQPEIGAMWEIIYDAQGKADKLVLSRVSDEDSPGTAEAKS
jgi:hypothetical protein